MASYKLIDNGDMSANVSGTVVDIRGRRKVFIRAQWGAAGAPIGGIGLKLGGDAARMHDIGLLDGANFKAVLGAQPNGGEANIHFWSNFRLTRVGSVWSCSAKTGCGSSGTIARVFNCESLMPTGANLATLQFTASTTNNLRVGAFVKLSALMPESIY